MESNIGERIRLKRQLLGMSQDELAKRVGYSSRSTINKIEKGINDITQTKIKEIAQALDTTPAYLMGWDEESETKNTEHNIYNEIGRHIKELRESRNISTSEMALEFNISIEDLKKYEKGLKEIPLETLRAFAIYFDTTIDELISVDVANKRATFITKDKTLSERYNKWQKVIGYDFEFTDEEVDEIINFAKFLISKRKDKK